MNELHFNFQTMAGYRQNIIKRGFNPFDYPEEWDFFRHPFEANEEDDILTDILFQIRKMTRRIHLFFEENDNRMETAFYFGLLDSLAEVDDYLLGSLKYSRYCRLEKLFLLAASQDLEDFLKKLIRIQDELLSKIRSYGERTLEFNQECHDGNLFLREYCSLTQHGIPNDMLHALLKAPNFPSSPDNRLTIDETTNFWSYAQNLHLDVEMVEDEPNIEEACNSSRLEEILEPVDMLLWHIRGTLLWVVVKKIKWVCNNTIALANRHDKFVGTMCKEAYEEVLCAYARSQLYVSRRDKELPSQCAEYLLIQNRKPTADEIYFYFINQYRNIILLQNKSQQLFQQHRNQKDLFYVEFLNLLLNEETREDAEDYLFVSVFSKELSDKKIESGGRSCNNTTESFVNGLSQKSESPIKLKTLIVEELKIECGSHPHFPECLSLNDTKALYGFLSQNRFINPEKTPLADFNYLMGASAQYTTPNGPKPICWIINEQMLRQMLLLAFSSLLKNGTSQASLGKIVPHCFVNEKNKPLKLPKNDERLIDYKKMKALKNFFTTTLRPVSGLENQ